MFDHLPIRPDVLVFALALLLYVTDLGRLIYANEVLFCSAGGGRWNAIMPSDGFFFRRRHAVFPRPYDPGCLVLSLNWPAQPRAADAGDLRERLTALQSQLSFPQLVCRLLAAEMFLGLPGAYLLPRHDVPVLLLLAVIYIQVLALVMWLFRSRHRLALPLSACLMWAFESLVCIPYAVNMHRKIGALLLAAAKYDVLDAAGALLDDPAQQALARQLQNAAQKQQR